MTNLASVTHGDFGGVARTPDEAAGEVINSFATSLYAELAGAAGNLVFAPAGIYAGLAMAWLGAQGETDAELERALFLPNDGEKLLTVFAALSSHKSQKNQVPGCDLSSANALWVDGGYALLPDYLKAVEERLSASVKQADFRRSAEAARALMNAWAEEETRGAVREPVPPGAVESLTRLVLMNATYFKGKWSIPFDRGETKEQLFYRPGEAPVDVPFMIGKVPARFCDNREEGVKAISMLYTGYRMEMVVIVPSHEGGLPELERRLDAARLFAIVERLDDEPRDDVKVYLPRFRVEASYELGDALERLGIRRAFDPSLADFSGITDDPRGLFLAAVLYKAMVFVDEEGTQAASVTAILPRISGVPRSELPEFRADRPFLFLIRDKRTDSILFLGRVVNPEP